MQCNCALEINQDKKACHLIAFILRLNPIVARLVANTGEPVLFYRFQETDELLCLFFLCRGFDHVIGGHCTSVNTATFHNSTANTRSIV